MENNKKLKQNFRKRLPLFLTGFSQVYFVAVNTYFLSKEMYLGVFISAFIISMIWSFNIKRIAFGSTNDRLVYALGATIGSVCGLWSSSIIALFISRL